MIYKYREYMVSRYSYNTWEGESIIRYIGLTTRHVVIPAYHDGRIVISRTSEVLKLSKIL